MFGFFNESMFNYACCGIGDVKYAFFRISIKSIFDCIIFFG